LQSMLGSSLLPSRSILRKVNLNPFLNMIFIIYLFLWLLQLHTTYATSEVWTTKTIEDTITVDCTTASPFSGTTFHSMTHVSSHDTESKILTASTHNTDSKISTASTSTHDTESKIPTATTSTHDNYQEF